MDDAREYGNNKMENPLAPPTNHPPQLTPLNTIPLLSNQPQNQSSLQWMKITKMLTTMKKKKSLG
jgi:hypothetical protein